MRNLIMGIIGVLWGGGILLAAMFNRSAPAANQAYAAGQSIGLIFGVLLLVAGILALVSGIRSMQPQYTPRKPKKKKKKRKVEYADDDE